MEAENGSTGVRSNRNNSAEDNDNKEEEEEEEEEEERNKINSNVEDSSKLEILTERSYSSKNDIVSAIVEYSNLVNRDYKIIQNDARRYYVRCARSTCKFRVNFNFRQNRYMPPSITVVHDCESMPRSRSPLPRAVRPRHLASLAAVRAWMEREGSQAETRGLRQLLHSMGIDVPYIVLFRTLKHLQRRRSSCAPERPPPAHAN